MSQSPVGAPLNFSRRDFLTISGSIFARSLWPHQAHSAEDAFQANVPVRILTRGPRHHWFGYYDKWQFDPSDRFVLSNEVPFEHRSPTADDAITVGYVDLEKGDEWTSIGESRAWCWQQGCMLQWVPNTGSTVIWNDREDDQFVSRVLDVKSGVGRTLPHPIYTLSPDGKSALTTDFRRLNELRPGYGYAGIDDPNRDVMQPSDVGIWSIDLASGEAKLIVPVAKAAEIGEQTPDMADGKHYFNHLLFNTDGTRFIFLHRWRPDRGRGNFRTRMFTANVDGSDLHVLDPSGNTSHFIWRDAQHVCAWTQPKAKPAGFYLFKDQTDEVSPVGPGVMTVNGHNTYLNVGETGEWILNDTYPDKERMQTVYLYHVPTNARFDLGRFPSPSVYSGEWRCDTHPRSSHNGKLVCIDSPHGKEGRQLHLLDVSGVVGGLSRR